MTGYFKWFIKQKWGKFPGIQGCDHDGYGRGSRQLKLMAVLPPAGEAHFGAVKGRTESKVRGDRLNCHTDIPATNPASLKMVAYRASESELQAGMVAAGIPSC